MSVHMFNNLFGPWGTDISQTQEGGHFYTWVGHTFSYKGGGSNFTRGQGTYFFVRDVGDDDILRI